MVYMIIQQLKYDYVSVYDWFNSFSSSSSDYWAGLFKSVISSTRLGVVVARSVSTFNSF